MDGAFGAATLGAVVAFQARNKLPPDGVGGANTWLALVKRITEAFVLADGACCRTPSGPVRSSRGGGLREEHGKAGAAASAVVVCLLQTLRPALQVSWSLWFLTTTRHR